MDLLLLNGNCVHCIRAAIFLLTGGTLAVAQSDSTLLFSDCSDSSEVKRVIQSADVIEVRHALVGGIQTCYSVSVNTGSGSLDGFLLGAKHPAVIQFERQEQAYIAQALPHPSEPEPNPKAAQRSKPRRYKLWNPFGSRFGTK
jgi:hypothetical protein